MKQLFANAEVAAKFDGYPPHVRPKLLALRNLIFQTAARTVGAGEIEESLKWGEPAYITRNKGGSTVRIDWKKKHPEQYAMYFNCQTSLVDTFRTLFPNDFKYEGNRALVFGLNDKLPRDSLAMCVAAALTYHAKKISNRSDKPAQPRSLLALLKTLKPLDERFPDIPELPVEPVDF